MHRDDNKGIFDLKFPFHNMGDRNLWVVAAFVVFFGIVPLCALVFGFANLDDHNCSYIGEYLTVAGMCYLIGTIFGIINICCCGEESCMTGDHGAAAILFNLACIISGIVILAQVPYSCLEYRPLLWGIGLAYVFYTCVCLFCTLVCLVNKRPTSQPANQEI